MNGEELRAHLARWKEQNPDHTTHVRTPWEKLREKSTRKTAIDAFCHDCMGWGEHDERPVKIRESIKECTVKDCPLYDWRPYK